MSTLAITGSLGRTQVRRQEGKEANCGMGGPGWALRAEHYDFEALNHG
jgi:hypothetical protein